MNAKYLIIDLWSWSFECFNLTLVNLLIKHCDDEELIAVVTSGRSLFYCPDNMLLNTGCLILNLISNYELKGHFKICSLLKLLYSNPV